jgi:hypothetical protein
MFQYADVGLKAVVEPSADITTGWTPAMDDLVMTSTSAQIARPAGTAGLLTMNMTI